MSESKKEENEKIITRRGFIKWTTALAVAGAAVIGIGAGYGSDLLLRPAVEKTSTVTTTATKTSAVTSTATSTAVSTTTATSTVTAPPPSLSYKPPLSPSVQARVNDIVNSLIARHSGETTSYYTFNTYTRDGRDNEAHKVHLRNGVLTCMEPDDSVNPGVVMEDQNWDNVLKGWLQTRPQARFQGYRKMIYDPNRLLYPMKKVGTRGDPSAPYQRITWDEALTTIVNAMQNAINKYGPQSVYDVGVTPLFAPQWFNAGATGWSIFSFPGHQFASLHACGSESYGSATQVTALFDTKMIVFWGHTPSNADNNMPRFYYTLAHEKGIPIISIHPRMSMTDQIQSDQWIPIRTGTDVAMALAVADVLIQENLYDKDFVNTFVNGFDVWSSYILGKTDGVEKTPEWAEPITGVPAATIRAFAELYGKTKPCMLITPAGSARSTLTENMAWAGILLQAMTGNIGKPGTHVSMQSCLKPQNFYSWTLPTYTTAAGRVAAKYSVPVTNAFMRGAAAILERADLDSGKITKAQFQQDIGADATWPVANIHVWIPTHYSLQMQMNVPKQIQAVKALDLFATMRARMDDPTAKYADIILPLVEEMERDPSFQPIVNGTVFCQKLLQPPGECKSEEWFNCQLANRMGAISTYFPITSQYPGWDTTPAVWDKMWMDMYKTAYNTWVTQAGIVDLKPPTWDNLLKTPVIRWTMPTPGSAANVPTVACYNEIQKGTGFATPSKKINAYDATIDAKLPSVNLAATKYGGYVDPYPTWNPALQFDGFYDNSDPNRPLLLFTTQPPGHTHSWMSQNPWLKGDLYEHTLQIGVSDAKARGIVDGDWVTITGDNGVARCKAQVTARLTPGIVHLYKGTYFAPDLVTNVDEGANTNWFQTDRACAAKTYANMGRVQITKQ